MEVQAQRYYNGDKGEINIRCKGCPLLPEGFEETIDFPIMKDSADSLTLYGSQHCPALDNEREIPLTFNLENYFHTITTETCQAGKNAQEQRNGQ